MKEDIDMGELREGFCSSLDRSCSYKPLTSKCLTRNCRLKQGTIILNIYSFAGYTVHFFPAQNSRGIRALFTNVNHNWNRLLDSLKGGTGFGKRKWPTSSADLLGSVIRRRYLYITGEGRSCGDGTLPKLTSADTASYPFRR